MNKQHSQEITSWAQQYQTDEPGQYALLIRKLGEAKGVQMAAESAYIMHHKRVPEWALYISSFWIDDDLNYVFIERDVPADKYAV